MDALAKPTEGEIADGFEIPVEIEVPILAGLGEEAGIVDGEDVVAVGVAGDCFIGEEIGHRGFAVAGRPRGAGFHVGGDVMREMGAGKRFGIAAGAGALRAGIVDLRGADGIGELEGGVAGRAGTHVAGGFGRGFLRADAREKTGAAEETGVAELALELGVSGSNDLVDGAFGDELVGLEKIGVFAPKRRSDRATVADKVGSLPDGKIAAGAQRIRHHGIRVGGERGGANVGPAARNAALVDELVAAVKTGFE